MKAIVLTYAPINDADKEMLIKTDIYKLALNQHSEELKPDARIMTDYYLEYLYNNFPQKIISIRDKLRFESERVEYPDIEFKGSTILAALEYLILKNYTEILIIGDNKVNSAEFQKMVNCDISKLDKKVKIYQYSKGNFSLPIKGVKDFINCNNEYTWIRYVYNKKRTP